MKHGIRRRMLCGSFLIFSVAAHADSSWRGYVNDKTFDDNPYGYLFACSQQAENKKIRLACHAPDTFELYLHTDASISGNAVQLTVDSLPAMAFTVRRSANQVGVSSQNDMFWPLMAQMIAGARLTVRWPDNATTLQYDLTGFTESYTRFCGWIESSRQYLPHLARYR
ncbi:MAG: hypothetical protein AAF404_00750 [Pseudomonadota bacterium]